MAYLNFFFSGRIGRKANWLHYLIPTLLIQAALLLYLWSVSTSAVIPIALPWLFIGLVKRMHAVGMSAWYLLLIVWLPLFVFLYVIMGWAETKEGPNKYGPGMVV